MTAARVLPAVVWVSDGRGERQRIARIVRAALAGGVRGFVLREPALDDAVYLALCEELLADVRRARGVLLAHGRVAPWRCGRVDGVQFPAAALVKGGLRELVPRPGLLGVSTHSREELHAAARAGADYALLGPVLPTASHPGAPGLGFAGVRALAATAAPLPVVGIGGIDAAAARQLRGVGLAGIACMRALADAADPARAAAELVAAFTMEAEVGDAC